MPRLASLSLPAHVWLTIHATCSPLLLQTQAAVPSHVKLFTLTLQMQLQGICAAMCKCLPAEVEPAVQCEMLFTMLRFAHFFHALDCNPPHVDLLSVLRHVAQYAAHQQTQSLALAILHRMQTYQSLQCLAKLLLTRRWSVLEQ